ncbi:uncharacterized protein LOC143878678 isoform X2 [Tasmannia lanceolata]|uniref:uncharacterized protein LOC143878678 isoform X2 n=1 Tax=Tasmannia lanceolata TaxID=3420 RepID=UPI0040641FEE
MDSQKDLKMDRLSLIDVSSEDDFLIASPSHSLQNLESSENCDNHDYFGVVGAESSQEGDYTTDIDKQSKQTPVLSEPSEPIITKRVAKCNLRKSLAWDSAFFTSEGVLDPDELAVVNKTFKKAERYALPGIQEDLRKSADSNSTLGSENWALENLEVDLFEDIGGSVQKSGDDYDTVSDISSCSSKACSSKAGPGKADIPGSSQKLDHSSRNRMRPVMSSKRLSISKQGSEKNSETLVRPQGAIRSGDQHFSSKPPKVLPRSNPLPTAPAKRNPLASSVSVKIKSNNAKALCGNIGKQRPVAISKKVISGDSQSGIPRSTPSLKASSSVSPYYTTMLSTTSNSPYSRSGYTSSGSIGKSGSKSLRNKSDSRNADKSSCDSTSKTDSRHAEKSSCDSTAKTDSRNAEKSSRDSTAKTPLRSLRHKAESGNTHVSAYLISTSKFSSRTSPASSLDDLSSESSSSTSTVNQKPCKPKASLDVSSQSPLCTRDTSIIVSSEQPDLQKPVQSQPSVGPEDSEMGLLGLCVQKASLETGIRSDPAAVDASGTCVKSNSGAQCLKPSGLRMPSPKIGFFDAEKSSAVHISNGSLQSHSELRSGLLKNASGIGNFGVPNKPKLNKLLPARSVAQTGTLRLSSRHSESPRNSSLKPTTLLQFPPLSNPSPKASGTLTMTESHPEICAKMQDLSLVTGGASHLNSSEVLVKVPDGAKYGQHFDLNPIEHGDQNVLENYLLIGRANDVHLSDTKISSKKEDGEQLFIEETSECNHENLEPSHKMGEKHTARTPLAVNYSFCNRSESFESTMELLVEKAMDKMSTSPFPEKCVDLEKPFACLDAEAEVGQENMIANSFYKDDVFRSQKDNSSE